MSENVFRLRIAGIGGQGVVHLATTISRAAADSGVPVSVIDRPRSAMRLGPITCDVIFRQDAFAPFIVPGEADAVLGLEPLDGIMNAAYEIKPDGLLVLNRQETPTIEEVVSGQADPRRTQWLEQLRSRGARVVAAACPDSAASLNYYLFGRLMAVCPDFPVSAEAIRQVLKEQEKNCRSFQAGLES